MGTESRLLTLFELLRQMSDGSETDPHVRVRELHRKRAEIDVEIERVLAGDMPLLGDTALKERFTQFATLARELLADFREVEHNFRGLDRRVRERITLWDGSKGALLQDILGERDLIAESDQGPAWALSWTWPKWKKPTSCISSTAWALATMPWRCNTSFPAGSSIRSGRHSTDKPPPAGVQTNVSPAPLNSGAFPPMYC